MVKHNKVFGKRNKNIGLVSIIGLQATVGPLLNIVEILSSISDHLYVITGDKGSVIKNHHEDNNVSVYLVRHQAWSNVLVRISRFIYSQLIVSYRLLRLSRKTDVWFFFGGWSLMPMAVAKLLRKGVIFASPGSSAKASEASHDFFAKVITFLENGNHLLADRIILYSTNLINQGNLGRYKNKIAIAQRHFLDFNRFKTQRRLNARDNLVGYIGRLSEEKGILNFVKAIPMVLEINKNVRFFVGGEGQMSTRVQKYLDNNNLNSKVQLVGWIPHDNLQVSLNDLKLLVVPSFTEGLPNIMLEAMACGTPVLVTTVGAMAEVITDNETGFILEDNSPQCIAQNVIRVLNHPNLEEIAMKARALVERQFTFVAAVESYRKVLYSTIS